MRCEPPKAPPFPVGTRVRYLGTREAYFPLPDGKNDVIIKNGLVVVITNIRKGRQGTGKILGYHDDGDPIYDYTVDGYSVYQTEILKHGRIIWPDNADEWEIVEGVE